MQVMEAIDMVGVLVSLAFLVTFLVIGALVFEALLYDAEQQS